MKNNGILMNHDNSSFQMLNQGKIVFFTWRNADGWPVIFVSNNVSKMLGYQADDFLQGLLRYEDLIHPQDVIRVKSKVTNAVETGKKEFTHEQYRIRNKDGKYHYVYDHTKFLEMLRVISYLLMVIFLMK